MEGWDGWILSQQLTSQSFAVIARNLFRTQYGGSLLRLALLCLQLRATQITSNVIRYRGYVLDAGAGHVYLFWRGWWWQSSFPSLLDQDILPNWPKVDFSTTNQFLVYDSDSLNTLTLQGSSKYALFFHPESEMIASTIGFHMLGLGWLKSQPEKFMIIDASSEVMIYAAWWACHFGWQWKTFWIPAFSPSYWCISTCDVWLLMFPLLCCTGSPKL